MAISGPSSVYTLLTNNTDGSGTFTPVTVGPNFNFFGASQTSLNPQLQVRDLDRDGWADFVYLHDDPTAPVVSGVYWQRLNSSSYVANGFRNFFRPNFRPSAFALEDFDRDGVADLVVTSLLTNEFSVVLADNPNPATDAPDWHFSNRVQRQASAGLRPVRVATADVNRDNLPDIAIAHEGSAEITLFLNLRNGQFGSQASYPLSAAPRQVLLRDLNNDGNPELIVLTADNQLQVFPHSGAAGLSRYGTPLTLATGADPVALELADVDGDYLSDVVVACAGDHTVRVYLNRSLATATGTRAPQLAGVEAYPNPATTQLTVARPAALRGPLTASLFDALGREVRRAEVAAPASTVSVADLPRGVYVLRLAAPAGVSSQRIVMR
ncbi:FG-GAP-like repeat-containing protein [Hymenobacter arizonensis]|uniref:FG-GAP-like repeat-containing protein n=1 Tax=Hymenobacter arizonensis TaxID=1227077 RepID=UPI0015A5EF33|nr:FG-GAP-like repeat-containing protein [Hymenobacter arizonensis]